MSSLGSFLWALCRHEPLHLGVYLPFSTHFCLTNAFQMLQSEPQNAKYNSVPDVQSPLFLASVGCQLTSLNEASHSILLGTPQRTTAKSQNVAWRHSTVYVTNACLRTTEDSVIVWIPKQPDENIPTWRSKICKKATGPRKIEGLELFWATTSCRKKKTVLPRRVLFSTGGLATVVCGRGFCLPWLPTHLEAHWKSPHLSHPFQYWEFTRI